MGVVIICQNAKQRVALIDSLRAFDLPMVGVYDANSVYDAKFDDGLIWLVDVDYDERLSRFIAQKKPAQVLVGLLPAPFLADASYGKWQRRLGEKLGIWEPQIACAHRDTWRYVVLLGASMGGIDAVKLFLDHLPADLPISLIIAHHFDANMLHTLPRLITRHNNWRCEVATVSQRLAAGRALVIPIKNEVHFDGLSRVIVKSSPWVGEYKPNIGRILKNLADVHDDAFIGILFSGMGDDGTQHLAELDGTCQLWAQSPESCQSPSQPKALIDSGRCDFIGDPVALATQLTAFIKDYHETGL